MLKVATATVLQTNNSADKLIPVLVLCPSKDEKQLFSSSDFFAYCFHCLEYSCIQTTPPKLKGEADLVAFCQDAIVYAQVHQIGFVYYSFDIANLVAAVVCQSLNLFGPSIEGVLNCFHKFYAREIDSYPPRYSVVQLANKTEILIDKDIVNQLKFPVFVKPVCSSYGMFCAKVEQPEQLEQVCKELASSYQPWWQMYQNLFQEFVDGTKYPIAVTSQVPLLVEELISGQPLTCDGFVYKGEVHFLGLVDTVEAQDGSVDCYAFPSQVSQAQQRAIYQRVDHFIQDSGLNNSFFSAEFWIQDQSSPILIEMNARMSATFGFLYQESLNFNLPKAALKLAQGICPQIPKQTSIEKIPTSIRLYLSTYKSGLASALFDFSLAQHTLNCSQLIAFNCEPTEQIQDTYYHPSPLAELNLVGKNRDALQFYGEHLRNALLLERRSPTYKITVVPECDLQGGEGLCYDSRRNQLFCLDYGNFQLVQLCLTTRKVQRFPLPSAFYGLAVSSKGTVILSGELGLVEWNVNTQELVPIVQEYQGRQLVCNDVVLDSTGYIWFNTIHENEGGIGEKGALLGCNPQGQVQEIFSGLGYANGMGISPDGRSLYVLDSLERTVHVFTFDSDRTEATLPDIREHYQFIVADENEGVPDGLAVDRAGRLWLTFWFGGKIVCIDPQLQVRKREIILPVMNITSLSVVDREFSSSAKLFACSSVVPWLGGEFLAPWYASDWPVEQHGYLFEIDVEL
ncbi:MAG: SMP-30/gluconolactonase/LRE family protein [Roseofilum sp. SBFL]|uniref:SMP-30/gluconolactonase/LRE family protein n=1 Tax=unclassified Roseofilum TaxID=2620099 RepID=UPI001B291451|nr:MULTISPECIES: SMP-30/gluconolactonase/LRE family protein [unclassified Roseofilum]MBP0011965.1 SMP-30/gluconolactonase/LRE family protein [Roseofilum sp. SID3]MBP0022966.1 SMP-30/gluconolactonase/LRE family protein [Roseofilum sp. SID2]MBP0037463.1 SMP-30/gluconolactonase/LRE family protein [Roseofilum sp. SID1]MBP0044748.1 SMP-30/gluconolactonase/LRE family protein [Roseofilum sp. SBFL]